MRAGPALTIRPSTSADWKGVSAVLQRNGMGVPVMDDWMGRRKSCPYAAEYLGIPEGWVLETSDLEIVGTLDNIPVLYELKGRRVKGVVASAWAVDLLHRSASLRLMTRFLGQQGIDLTLIVSASPTTARLMTAMKIARIPTPSYSTPLFWAVNRRNFVAAALMKRAIPGAAFLSWPVGMALACRDILIGAGRSRRHSTVRRLAAFDARFDQWGTGFAGKAERLNAVRTRSILEWRFGAEFRNGRATLLVAEAGTELLGYTILIRRSGAELGMELFDVADLQAVGDGPTIICDLLLGAIQVAREEGVDAVKYMTGTPAKRSAALSLHPYSYELPIWQLYYKTTPGELAGSLTDPDDWDFSLFDTY